MQVDAKNFQQVQSQAQKLGLIIISYDDHLCLAEINQLDEKRPTIIKANKISVDWDHDFDVCFHTLKALETFLWGVAYARNHTK